MGRGLSQLQKDILYFIGDDSASAGELLLLLHGHELEEGTRLTGWWRYGGVPIKQTPVERRRSASLSRALARLLARGLVEHREVSLNDWRYFPTTASDRAPRKRWNERTLTKAEERERAKELKLLAKMFTSLQRNTRARRP